MRARAWEEAGRGGLAACSPQWLARVYLLPVASALGEAWRDGIKVFHGFAVEWFEGDFSSAVSSSWLAACFSCAFLLVWC